MMRPKPLIMRKVKTPRITQLRHLTGDRDVLVSQVPNRDSMVTHLSGNPATMSCNSPGVLSVPCGSFLAISSA